MSGRAEPESAGRGGRGGRGTTVILNALAATGWSGQVQLTHLIPRLPAAVVVRVGGPVRLVVLANDRNASALTEAVRRTPGARVVLCPLVTCRWPSRWAWERLALWPLVRRLRASCVIQASGTVTGGLGVPEIPFAYNPWPFLAAHEGRAARAKAALQRRAYRVAVRRGAVVVFNSETMYDLYVHNAGRGPQRSVVAPLAPEPDAVRAARAHRVTPVPFRVLSVACWCEHKNAEVLLEAVAVLRRRGTPATLRIVGSWSSSPVPNPD